MVVRISPENHDAYYAEVPVVCDAAEEDTYEPALLVEEWFEENGIIAESYDILDDDEAEEVKDRGLLT